jgi:hypothetical protein
LRKYNNKKKQIKKKQIKINFQISIVAGEWVSFYQYRFRIARDRMKIKAGSAAC